MMANTATTPSLQKHDLQALEWSMEQIQELLATKLEQSPARIETMETQLTQLSQKLQYTSDNVCRKIVEVLETFQRAEKEKGSVREVKSYTPITTSTTVSCFNSSFPTSPAPTSLQPLQFGTTADLLPTTNPPNSIIHSGTRPYSISPHPHITNPTPYTHLSSITTTAEPKIRPTPLITANPIPPKIAPHISPAVGCHPYPDSTSKLGITTPISTPHVITTSAIFPYSESSSLVMNNPSYPYIQPIQPLSVSTANHDQSSEVLAMPGYSVPFSGSDPCGFIQGYEEFFKVNPMTEVDMIQYVMQDFEGEALEWYYQYVEEKFLDTWTPDCWEDFVTKLYKRFACEHQVFVERTETNQNQLKMQQGDTEIGGCLHLLYHPSLLGGGFYSGVFPSSAIGMLRKPADVLGQVHVVTRMRQAEVSWELAYGGPMSLVPLAVSNIHDNSLQPQQGNLSLSVATIVLAAPIFRLISIAIQHPGNNEELYTRGPEVLSRNLNYLLQIVYSLDVTKHGVADEELVAAIATLCQSQKSNHVLKVQLFSTLLLDLKIWSLCSYGLQKKILLSLADLVFTEASVMRGASVIQMLLDGCRRCYWTIREKDSLNTFSLNETMCLVGELKTLVGGSSIAIGIPILNDQSHQLMQNYEAEADLDAQLVLSSKSIQYGIGILQSIQNESKSLKKSVKDVVTESEFEKRLLAEVIPPSDIGVTFGKIGIVVVESSLVDIYAKCESIAESQLVFDRMTKKNSVSWSPLLGGYCQKGDYDTVIELFRVMEEVNLCCFGTILHSYAGLAVVKQRKEVHSQYLRRGGWKDVMESALADLYAQCGRIDFAYRIFKQMLVKNLVTWNSVICGLAQNGRCREAIHMLNKTIEEGIEPDYITYVRVLFACCHTGLLDEGRKYFISMTEKYGIEAGMKHYTCMVDFLGCAEQIEEVEELLKKSDFENDSSLWATLLRACAISRNYTAAEHVAKKMMELEPDYHLSYVFLANVDRDVGPWNDALAIAQHHKAVSGTER